MTDALKAYSITAISETPGKIGYRTRFISGRSEEEAIGKGMAAFSEHEPEATISNPAALEVTAERLSGIGVDLPPQWQPIETAPENVEVLVWSAEWTVPYLIKATLKDNEWAAGGFCISNPYQPTHWMLLPQPPAE